MRSQAIDFGRSRCENADMRLRNPAGQIAWRTSFPISAAASIEEPTGKIAECLGCNFSMEIHAYKPQLP
jgi:hypothetical protein